MGAPVATPAIEGAVDIGRVTGDRLLGQIHPERHFIQATPVVDGRRWGVVGGIRIGASWTSRARTSIWRGEAVGIRGDAFPSHIDMAIDVSLATTSVAGQGAFVTRVKRLLCP